MARTALPVSPLVRNGSLADPAGTTIDQANGMYVDANGVTGKILLRVANTNGTARVVTLKAGTSNPPAFRKDEGDLAVSVPATTGVRWLGPFDSSQFVQPQGGTDGGVGGRLFLDFAASFAGTITAFQLP